MGFGQLLRQPGSAALPPWDPSGVVSSGGGGQGSTAGMGAGVSNAYDRGGNLSSILSREGIDIGPQPDFWKDLNSIVTRLRPRQGPAMMPAQQQARALRAPEPVAQERPAFAGPQGGGGGGGARFATLNTGGPGFGPAWYQQYTGGAFTGGAPPVATYSG